MERVILVTGASGGIGLGVALRLASDGHIPILGMRDPEAAIETEGLIGDEQRVQLDVTNPASVTAAERFVRERFGRLDGLVNNAAIFHGHDPLVFPEHEASQLFETNMFGPWRVTLSFLELLQRSSNPCIVNVSSDTASIGLTASGTQLPGKAERRLGYCCTKSALNMLTAQLQLAFDRSPPHRHIRINAVSPGYTATRMNNYTGDKTIQAAARTIAAAAVLEPDGPTGTFFGENGGIAW